MQKKRDQIQVHDANTKPKIFGIGLNKTGTTTLNHCGKLLGYRTKGFSKKLLKDVVRRNDLSRVKKVAGRYDLMEDWPWPLVYKDLDRAFPGSRFILTVRKDVQTWFKSLKKHSIRTHPIYHSRKLVYGYNYPHSNKEEHLDMYKRHRDEVREYFKNDEDRFTELCWEEGDGWEELCGFLGEEVPDKPLPHAKKGSTEGSRTLKRFINRILIRILS